MRVVVRADASVDIGTGHVMRCLTLARRLHGWGATVLFVCRELDGQLCGLIEEQGFAASRLPAHLSWQQDAEQTIAAIQAQCGQADLLIVDHYGLDARWERVLRLVTRRLLVVDDLADRAHECDVLLDQNLHDSPESRYAGLAQTSTRVFVGPQFALLRPEFDAFEARVRDQGLQRLLVFMGGTDPSNEVLKLVLALRALGAGAPPTKIVLGPSNQHAESVRQAAQGVGDIEVMDVTSRMAALINEADLGIGTCGGAAWERCVLGLPTLVAVNAENQREDARILDVMGAVRNLGDAASISVECWASEIRALRDDPAQLARMSVSAAAVMKNRKLAMQELEAALAI